MVDHWRFSDTALDSLWVGPLGQAQKRAVLSGASNEDQASLCVCELGALSQPVLCESARRSSDLPWQLMRLSQSSCMDTQP